ncbi:MAG TPA: AarF/ABC1/UbiB kinase family protein [Gemmatimonadaceae bacterium]|nr:AarF/ABC1/UbiB kinase family protein [Gemmatimonadaceae bacterium]
MARNQSPTRRALKVAATTASVTGSYLGYLAQYAFLGDASREQKLKSTHAKAGKRIASDLQSLRGPAMKLGQLLSVQSGVLPEETLAALASLQREAPAMHPSLVRAQFKAAMGAAPETVFRTFDETPFAAASLGQVHRAVTRRGETVAVKIQYPAIEDAVRNDFTWFRAIATASQIKRLFPESLIREMEQHIVAETDYEAEASSAEFFATGLEPLDYVEVPRIRRDLSAGTVLTMSMLAGESLDAFLAQRPSQRLRNLVGERLLELFYFQVLQLGAFHADPHWGNYLFRPDGSIGLVDFGCVKRLDPAFVDNLSAVFLFPGSRESAEFRKLLVKRYALVGQRLTPKMHAALVRMAKDFYGRFYPPDTDRESQPIDFGDGAVINAYIAQSQSLLRAKVSLPEYVFLGRVESGLYNTLHRLGARVRTSMIVRRWLR